VNDGLRQIKWLNNVDTPMAKWASMERQRFLVMYLGSSGGHQVGYSQKQSFGCLYRLKKQSNTPCPSMKMSVNGASTIPGHVSWIIWGATGCI
jgi:hypothetical protein